MCMRAPETRLVPKSDRSARLDALAPFLRDVGADVESVMVGNSMHPTIPAGTKIRIHCTSTPIPRVGQVLAIANGDRLIVHRVVHCGKGRRTRQWVLTCGDARRLPDAPAPVDTVVGEVTGKWDGTGWTEIPSAPADRPTSTLLLTAARVGLELHPPSVRAVAAFFKLGRGAYRRARTLGRRQAPR